MSFEYDLKNSVWSLLEELSKKSGISEVIINSTDNIFIEREGELILLNMNLAPSDIISFCKDVAKFNRSLFGPNNPIVDGTLPDGSRINIISSVYTSSSPAITIRKYLKEIQRFDSSPAIFGLSPKWVTFLKTLIQAKMNIVISGGTGNGKTTFLNLLLQEVNPTERVITIEDTKELSFSLPNTVRLVTAKGSSRVEEPLKIRDLLKNTLRMRPDRIIIGEVRGEEAFDLFLLSGYDVPLKAVRQQMSTAIDFIIQLDRSREGKRIVSRVAEVSNMEGDVILLQDLGNYVDGEFVFNGLVPKRMPKLLEYDLKSDFFL
jgi:pilus assembly protein CpaF